MAINGDPSATRIPLSAVSPGTSAMQYTFTSSISDFYGLECIDDYSQGPGGGSAVVQVPTSLSAPTLSGVKSQTSGPVNDYFGHPETTTSECGVYECLVSDLLDQSGNKMVGAFTLTEMFSGYTTTIPGLTTPSTQSSPQDTSMQRLADTQFFGTPAPSCLRANDNESFDQSFSVDFGGTTYMLTTVRHILRGYFDGNPNVTVMTNKK